MTVLTPANAFPNLAFPQHLAPVLKVDAVGTYAFTAQNTSGANYTGITVGSGINRALIIMFGLGGTITGSPTAIWDSGGTNQTMTLLTSISNAAGSFGPLNTYLFGLVAPTSGNKTCAITWTGNLEAKVAGISFTGVDQTGGVTSFPNGTSITTTGVGTQVIPTPVGSFVVSVLDSDAGLGTAVGNVIFTNQTDGAIENTQAGYSGGNGGSVTVGFTGVGGGGHIALSSVAVKPLVPLFSNSAVTSFTYPGAVWPKATGPAVLSWTNGFPNLAFPQHLSGQTNTVQNFLYPGAVQPQVSAVTLWAQSCM